MNGAPPREVSAALLTLPEELRDRAQWVVYRLETRDGRATKVPYRADAPGRKAASTKPDTWATFERALAALQATPDLDGIGFVFADDDPYMGVDLDHCVDPVTGELHPLAHEIVSGLDTYAERSRSGTGVHIICRATLPDRGRRETIPDAFEVELYCRGRYFTMTGERVSSTAEVAERQSQVDELLARYFAKPAATSPPAPAAALEPKRLEDRKLIEKALKASNGSGFAALWRGDISAYDGNASRADCALFTHLAFWTGGDTAQMERIAWQSGLRREKWEREDYMQWTIEAALEENDGRYYTGKHPDSDRDRAGRGDADRSASAAGEVVETADTPDAPPAKETPAAENLTDTGNAHRFARLHSGRVLYVRRWGARLSDGWRVYEPATGLWRDEYSTVLRFAQETARTWNHDAADEQDTTKRRELQRHAMSSESNRSLKAMLELATAELALQAAPADFDADPLLLNVANGVVDLRTGVLLPHSPKYRMTKTAGTTYSAAAECPLWEQFLARIFAGNGELIEWTQMLVGYCLTGDTSEQIVTIGHGSGSNGKSVWEETVRALLGDYATAADVSAFTLTRSDVVRNDLARLAGARLVTAVESGAGARLDEGLVKQATGGEPIVARFLHQEHFEYVPQFKLVLLTNHRPTIHGTDHGIWRRIRLAPFDVTIPDHEQDHHLADKLRDELPGILAWAVRGCLEWQRLGRLPTPPAIMAATEEYRAEQDALGDFWTNWVVFGERTWTPAKELRAALERWAAEVGIDPRDLPKTSAWGRLLADRGARREQRKLSGTVFTGYSGVRIVGADAAQELC